MQETVEYVPHAMLRTHPRNMRRIYPRHEVEQMAGSIEARVERGVEGIIEPLIGCWAGEHIVIVVGNKRLKGVRLLGDEAPLVPVIVREKDEAEQLLDMATENVVRSRPDPISEALHYQALLEQEGMTVARLSRETGVAVETIRQRLLLPQLEPEIQGLIVEEKLPKGRRPVEALLSLPAGELRVETARELARRRASVRQIVSTCTRVRRAVEGELRVAELARGTGRVRLEPVVQKLLRAGKLPATEAVVRALVAIPDAAARVELALALAERRAGEDEVVRACEQARRARESEQAGEEFVPALAAAIEATLAEEQERRVAWEMIGAAILQCCRACREPAWREVVETVRRTCGGCGARELPGVCQSCALVEFVGRLVRRVEREAGRGRAEPGMTSALAGQGTRSLWGGGNGRC